ncbi:hypothetical protein CLOHYLEM_05702 [[Clostridium] hylemonae DSM 15053]|uniref:Uncharacterized protein n=1 Tax=[Clostridium] hylemonae DSM 15053 TaxID=553973 RepID=C0C243_9FIRM|nr:hypothetical protein CLOHYLEM_05702 [[Clostridium] hylemonae DSM 15053]
MPPFRATFLLFFQAWPPRPCGRMRRPYQVIYIEPLTFNMACLLNC